MELLNLSIGSWGLMIRITQGILMKLKCFRYPVTDRLDDLHLIVVTKNRSIGRCSMMLMDQWITKLLLMRGWWWWCGCGWNVCFLVLWKRRFLSLPSAHVLQHKDRDRKLGLQFCPTRHTVFKSGKVCFVIRNLKIENRKNEKKNSRLKKLLVWEQKSPFVKKRENQRDFCRNFRPFLEKGIKRYFYVMERNFFTLGYFVIVKKIFFPPFGIFFENKKD